MASGSGAEPRKAIKGLGSLEAQLMAALWSSTGPLSVQEVCDCLGPDHNYKTVMTVLNRLVDKELLSRDLDGRAYKYTPSQTRDQFLVVVADELVNDYLAAYGPQAAKHLSAAIGTPAPAPQQAAPGPAPVTPTPMVPAVLPPEEPPLKVSPLAVLVGAAVILQIIILLRLRR